MTPMSSEFLSRAAAFPVVSCVLVHMAAHEPENHATVFRFHRKT